MKIHNILLTTTSIIAFFGCIGSPKEIIKTNNIEIQLLDGETEMPIPNIKVYYYFDSDKPGSWGLTEYRNILYLKDELFSDNNGIVNISEKQITKKQSDYVKLKILINTEIDKNEFIKEVNKFLNTNSKYDINAYFEDLYFRMNYRKNIKFINDRYYLAYASFLYKEERNQGYTSYIIMQKDNGISGEFQTEFINNEIYGENRNRLIIKLYPIRQPHD